MRKQFKIKIINGEIRFEEPIDLSNVREGIVIFFDEKEQIRKVSDIDPLSKMIGTIKEPLVPGGITPELIDKELYDRP